jgi:hypothetical protein
VTLDGCSRVQRADLALLTLDGCSLVQRADLALLTLDGRSLVRRADLARVTHPRGAYSCKHSPCLISMI